jgi:hypothetical protein
MRSALLSFVAATALAGTAPKVVLLRTPDSGLQPQAAVDATGALHLIYYKGDISAGDIYYVRRAPGAPAFSSPIRVNSQPASAIAAGSIRGAQLALGKNGRVHVAWNGSKTAQPPGPNGSSPMLYTRLNDAGAAFEPQRNLMHDGAFLDGGGTLAADGAGHVWVAWHAMGEVKGEDHRRVYVAVSRDDGRAFAREVPAWREPTGACGCCGMRAFAGRRGILYMLYRAATEAVDRDMVLLVSADSGRTFRGSRIDRWKLNACPMTSESIVEGAGKIEVAWQTQKQVYFAPVDPGSAAIAPRVAPPGEGSRKYPALAINPAGETLLAWAEDTGWQKGGSLAWQLFDSSGHPIGDSGRAPGVPANSFPAAFAGTGGAFTIVY